jgi:predicted AAA+ superfamily ATPase
MKRPVVRDLSDQIRRKFESFDCVVLLGPRQVGKTYLSRALIKESGPNGQYLDLASDDANNVIADLGAYLDENAGRLIVLDEAQARPELFPKLRHWLDQPRSPDYSAPKILLLGSASAFLQRLAADSLGGRYSFADLTAFQLGEIETAKPDLAAASEISAVAEVGDVEISGEQDAKRLWLRGGWPLAYFDEDDQVSIQRRQDFIRAYVEHDIPAFDVAAGSDKIGDFWNAIARNQGQPFHSGNFGAMQLKADTADRYIRCLERLHLLRLLKPWFPNIEKRHAKNPRAYVRDSGLLHALLGLPTHEGLITDPLAGKSWEGFVIETLVVARGHEDAAFFYRDEKQNEIDLVLEFDGKRRWAIEIKLGDPGVNEGFHAAAKAIGAERRIVVHGGPHSSGQPKDIDVMTLPDAMREVRAFS